MCAYKEEIYKSIDPSEIAELIVSYLYEEVTYFNLKSIYINGVIDGIQTSSYQGKPSKILEYRNGKRHGATKLFYESGKIKSITHYENDQKTGEYKSFYESGQIEEVCHYIDGILVGLKQKFYESGQMESTISYNTHEYKKYNSDGTLNFRVFYDKYHHRLDGLYEKYEDGKLIEQKNYRNNKLHGLYLKFKGVLIEKSYFHKGKFHSQYSEYYESGQIKVYACYQSGNLTDLYQSFYPNGKHKIIAWYRKGKLHGKYEQFDETGQLEIKAYYSIGYLDGLYEKYKEGQLIKSKIYKINLADHNRWYYL